MNTVARRSTIVGSPACWKVRLAMHNYFQAIALQCWVARLLAIQSGHAQLRRGDHVYDRWVARMLERLILAHLGIMVIAAVAVVVLTAGSYRWLAWAAILAAGVLGFLLFDMYSRVTCVPHY